jgi:hypothetical protein
MIPVSIENVNIAKYPSMWTFNLSNPMYQKKQEIMEIQTLSPILENFKIL